ncbi:DEAD/DEAH box helicase [Mucilaginibacter aquariorum]|uniref:DEAD/DEAH box helicase n=1 Tax=Mucilaginibacter aquariorum TaxID=2967225 RepID=A0ABT1T124_9SPHI|nr:DEAD/DEAH box helicase [Mucilaginibacter aquariorum]MCQ6958306.1 DEAD/DEAH box helicase [Mucilaginibacter aquariorum]
MNFKNLYHQINNRLKEAIISLWATGDATMQRYFSQILEREGLMAEPVFQTGFPWEPSPLTFGEADKVFSRDFIDKLAAIRDPNFQFPHERHPYKHQYESWDTLLNLRRSIAVTTGTGSGKTECFMLPVLYDIFKHKRDSVGVNAIFLYPLNALIGSQKKRVDAWCRALGGIKYAVYNGNTPENVKAADAQAKLPELMSRPQIRKDPPQILFTNPAMLEYMLVRNKDVELLQKSKGALRWILLDEAHTLTGSGAAEMALLIRRVVDAFQTDISQIRFAITSATVGAGPENQEKLKKFMADLCGIPAAQITLITGHRVLSPELNMAQTAELDSRVVELRKELLIQPALSLGEIGRRFETPGLDERLDIVDQLSNHQVSGRSILPVRGHFFARGIGGVFVCTNPECTVHGKDKPAAAPGHMTTIAGGLCKCGSQLLELVACRTCDHQLLEGERITDRKTGDDRVRMVSAVVQDPFTIDLEDEEEDNTDPANVTKFYFTRRQADGHYHPDTVNFDLTTGGELVWNNGQFTELDSGAACPHCGERVHNPQHFRSSASFINRILADILLEITPEAAVPTTDMLWKGHKYISFTDSRQGTAKISALINQDNEANWVRSQVYHRLCRQKQRQRAEAPVLSPEELEFAIADAEEALRNNRVPALQKKRQRELDEYIALRDEGATALPPLTLSWRDAKIELMKQTDFGKLFHGNNPGDKGPGARDEYLTALLYDQFARRMPKKRSLENLGMVNLVYPDLAKAHVPAHVTALGISPQEWQDLLKIAADYVIRLKFYFQLPQGVYRYGTEFLRSFSIYNPDAQQASTSEKWPLFDRRSARPNKLALLICAGLGLHDRSDIDNETEDQVNELMRSIWVAIRTHLLEGNGDGYQMNLEAVSHFQLAGQLFLCPVKKRLIDTQFRGYSPWISGSLNPENIQRYAITRSTLFPEFPHAFNKDAENQEDLAATRAWLAEASAPLREAGLWNNLHEQVILYRPLYLSGEHSAQQNEKRLDQLEQQFEKSEINILNCSTTMEMGVDIGGISMVVMNNVPPSPANYLQRAGRAGRRFEAQSLAFTICPPNPIGMNAWNEPKWALTHPIASPYISFSSETLVMRHVNAFFLGKFVQDELSGINLTIDTERFFFHPHAPTATLFTDWILRADVYRCEAGLASVVSGTPLEGKQFAYLLNKAMKAFQDLHSATMSQQESFTNKLAQLDAEFGDRTPAYKAVDYQYRQFREKNAIGYLAESGFLPSAGLPTGIIDFDTVNVDDLKNKTNTGKKPAYFITRALSEFAPGNQVVIDGKGYEPAGIILKNDRGVEAEREIIQSCKNCGFQRILKSASAEDFNKPCPHCTQTEFTGINFKDPTLVRPFTEMIQPAGFAVDLYEEPTRKITEASSVQYVDPLLINIKPWNSTSLAIYDTRESEENAEILYYNVGRGNGYSVCLHCGRAATDAGDLLGHTRLRGGKNNTRDTSALCSGNSAPHGIHHNVILGGKFQTGFCEIRFRDEQHGLTRDETLLYTLGAVLSKELAHFLAIEQAEISFGIKRYAQFSSVFIFDTAKGGAGYAAQFPLYAEDLFKIARKALSGCECEHACTQCLIDRNTQWHIDKLDKQPALAWLKRALSSQVPDAISTAYPRTSVLASEIKAELGRLADHGKLQEVRLVGTADFQNWELDRLQLISKLRGRRIKVNFVLEQVLGQWSIQDKMTLIQLEEWASCAQYDPLVAAPLQTICEVILQGGEVVSYLAADFERNFDEHWGRADISAIYKYPGATIASLKPILVRIDEQQVQIANMNVSGPITSDAIAAELLKLLPSMGLEDRMQGQTFAVSYYDRYLRTPLGCMMTVQFVAGLRDRLAFRVSSFTFKGVDFEEDREPYIVSHNLQNALIRNELMEEFAADCGLSNVLAENDSLPHFRYFEFRNEKLKVIIRPDAGIAHGWYPSGPGKTFSTRTNGSTIVTINKKDNDPLLYTVSVENV